MGKRQLTNREQLNKELRKSAPDSILRKELMAVKAAIENDKRTAVRELLNLLKSITTQIAKHFVATILGSLKDPRIIRPLMRAAIASDNKNYSCNFLWPLAKYDCTKHLSFFVNLILEQDGYNEVMWVCIEVIRTMKGPFEPLAARKNIRKLLAEVKFPLDESGKTEVAALRLEAVDSIMAKYFNHTLKAFWVKWNAGEH